MAGKIAWHVRNSEPQEFYWLHAEQPQAKSDIIVSRAGQTIEVDTCPTEDIVIRLNDEMVNLDEPVVIKTPAGKATSQTYQRNIMTLFKTLQERGDKSYMFPVEVSVSTQ